MFSASRSYKFSDTTAVIRLVLVAIISSVTFYTATAFAASSGSVDIIRENGFTAQGEREEVTIEIPENPEDAQTVIDDAMAVAKTANATIVESDVTVGAATNALLATGIDANKKIMNSMFVEREVPLEPQAKLRESESKGLSLH